MYENRTMEPVEFFPRRGEGRIRGVIERMGLIWYIACIYENITMKLLCTTNMC
jgi:hypothetical protein